jgi:segregation and condensation protein A
VADEAEFRVELESFSGPMDLLLYLIQKEEVDVHDIPVARILERYLEVLRAGNVLDLDRAGEFLVMASTLLAVKSAMLLPGGAPEMGEVIDPREDLVRQILEYRRVKEAGRDLEALREEAGRRWPRGSAPLPEVPPEDAPEPPGVREATLYDVFAAFHRLLRETRADETRRIQYDEVPMEVHVERILGAVGTGGGRAGLLALLGERRDRAFVLGTFLAILELMKEGRLLAVQEGTGIEVVHPESEAGRAVLEAVRARARRQEEETPEGKPRRRPPWRRDGPGGAAEAGTAPPGEASGAGDGGAAPGAPVTPPAEPGPSA